MFDTILIHQGRQHNYKTYKSISDYGLDAMMVTGLYLKPFSILAVLYRFGPKKLRIEISKRQDNSILNNRVVTIGELNSLIVLFLSRTRPHASSVKTLERFSKWYFNKKVIKLVLKFNPKSIYIFDTSIRVDRLRSKGYEGKVFIELSGSNPLYINKVTKYETENNIQTKDYINEYNFSENDEKLFYNTLEFVDRIIVPAKSVIGMINAVYDTPFDQKTTVIPYGLNGDGVNITRAALDNGKLRVLFVGRASISKGFHLFLELSKLFLHQDMEFTVIGDVYHTKISELIDEHPNVRFLGRLSNAKTMTLMGQNDILILPTLFEGMSLTILEAMSKGLVVITTKVSGYSEIFYNNENGIIVDPIDVNQIAHYLNLFKNNTKELDKIGKNAQLTSVNYTWEKYGLGVAKSIKEIIDGQ